MEIEDLNLLGAKLIKLPRFEDQRGIFVKTFNDNIFQSTGIDFELKESYYSFSKANVIRGMHFQLPPYDHAKIVFCPQGAILDVMVDLRKDSATYGKCVSQVLSQDNNLAFYIPKGFAHGFKSLADDSITYYLVSSTYHQASDTGIRYDSLAFDWDVEQAIVSDRDLSFDKLVDFESPF